MIKLIENELIKIFKRKSIYLLLFLSIIVIVVYNKINPDQNKVSSFLFDTSSISIKGMEDILASMENVDNEYTEYKANIDFWKLFNSFEENSWQRYALREESLTHFVDKVYTDYNLDIRFYLFNINDYELNKNSKITLDQYKNSKIKYDEYVNALKSNDWKDFVSLKIKNLEERKNKENLQNSEIEEINLEIELYKVRLNNDINYSNDIQNHYLQEYKSNYYSFQSYEVNPYTYSKSFITNEQNNYKYKINLCKYALQNKIFQDISAEENLIINNKIDARISFIRTFNHFDLIIVTIAIFISSTIVTEEINKKTIKTLLIKPHNRSTILISKIIASIITIIISMIFVAISQFIIGGIIFGFNSYSLKYIGYDLKTNHIVTMSLLKYIILIGLLKLPIYIIIIEFCIFIGIVNKNTAMSMILTLIIFIISSTAIKEWSNVEALSIITRYFITNNWDFTVYLFGQVSKISGITLSSSILIFLIHAIILLLLSIKIFNKKEIENVS